MRAHDVRMLRAAVRYACAGLHVFPLKSGGKYPHRGSCGELDASDDPAWVESLWRALPGSNIGLALRYHPGLMVLDIDDRSGGNAWLARRPPLPDTVRVLTPSGDSAHHWLSPSLDIATIGARGLADDDARVDLKGLPHGYVLLPPSRVDGREYLWSRSPRDVTVAPCPEWLESEIWHSKQPKTSPASVSPVQHARPVRPAYGAPRRSLVELLRERGLLGPELRPGVWLARCPGERHHSDRRRPFAGDTLVFSPVRPGAPGWLYCAHAHCQDIMRDVLEGKT